MEELDALIRRADQTDRQAIDKLFAVLYDEIHRLAEHNLRRAGATLTLGTTTLGDHHTDSATAAPVVPVEPRMCLGDFGLRARRPVSG